MNFNTNKSTFPYPSYLWGKPSSSITGYSLIDLMVSAVTANPGATR